MIIQIWVIPCIFCAFILTFTLHFHFISDIDFLTFGCFRNANYADHDCTTDDNNQDKNETKQIKLENGPNVKKSTLSNALKNEIQSAPDLETCIELLETNFTSTLSILESKNMLIEELQNRIIMFEDDKIVLKKTLDAFKNGIENEIEAKDFFEDRVLSLEQ